MKKTLYALFALVIAGFAAWYLTFYAPNWFEGDRIIMVSRGENFSQIADTLAAKGVLFNKQFFKLAARLKKLTTRMQIGKYRFKSGMSNF